MNRRRLIQLGMLGGTASLLAPQGVLGREAGQPLNSPMAGGLFYTREAPGRWSKKVASHIPNLEMQPASDGKIDIQVVTRHDFDGYKHYIIKHVLLDKDFRFMMENTFDPMTAKYPESVFTLDAYSGPLYALSVCNKHDTWIDVLEV
jgi:superoxide reductase